MLTVQNNLASHLVIPDGVGEGIALKVGPQGKAKVAIITAALKNAENRGLVVIHFPEGKTETKPKGLPKKKGGRRKKQR